MSPRATSANAIQQSIDEQCTIFDIDRAANDAFVDGHGVAIAFFETPQRPVKHLRKTRVGAIAQATSKPLQSLGVGFVRLPAFTLPVFIAIRATYRRTQYVELVSLPGFNTFSDIDGRTGGLLWVFVKPCGIDAR